jgi:hypothetical protein
VSLESPNCPLPVPLMLKVPVHAFTWQKRVGSPCGCARTVPPKGRIIPPQKSSRASGQTVADQGGRWNLIIPRCSSATLTVSGSSLVSMHERKRHFYPPWRLYPIITGIFKGATGTSSSREPQGWCSLGGQDYWGNYGFRYTATSGVLDGIAGGIFRRGNIPIPRETTFGEYVLINRF